MLRHVSQWELQGGDGAVLTSPQLPSSSPIFITILYTADPKSPRTYPPTPKLLTTDPYVQLAISSRITHRLMTLTTSKIKSITLPANNLSPPSPSQAHYLPVT